MRRAFKTLAGFGLVAAVAGGSFLTAAQVTASSTVSGRTGGSAERGKLVYETQCLGCHSVAQNHVGPRHLGVVGRKAGSVQDYGYSNALKRSSIRWSEDTLQQWLADPEKLIPGQVMDFSLGDAKDRADVVAYLATLK